ncbi:MAG: hypothetical protein GY754_46675 [bacterium]|nr:hypothetical protein [bacterium]
MFKKKLEKITKKKLEKILVNHGKWLDVDFRRRKKDDPRRANLSGLDLRGFELIGANLDGANLMGVNLTEVDLAGANFSRVDFTGAKLSMVDLTGAELIQANFSRANLNSANLSGAKLNMAILSGARLRKTKLIDADLTGADLTGADLIVATLICATLLGADLTGANLKGTNFSGASLCKANLEEANLAEAILIKADLRGAILKDANLLDTFWEETRGVYPKNLRLDVPTAAVIKNFYKENGYFEESDHFYVKQISCLREKYQEFRNVKQIKYSLYQPFFFFWWLTSRYSTSINRWFISSCIFPLCFGSIFLYNPLWFNMNSKQLSEWGSAFTPFYFSIVTFTTLGFGDVTPITLLAKLFVCIEVIYGYIMLGILITLIGKKLDRN